MTGGLDEGFHVREIAFQSGPSMRTQAVFGAGEPSMELLFADNVAGVFQLAGVDAEIAVGGGESLFQVVECHALVDSKGANDAEPEPLMNDTVERACGAACQREPLARG